MKELTQIRLKEKVIYDHDTGLFTHRYSCTKHLSGDSIGSSARDGYRTISIDGGSYPAHRLAWLYMTGRWPNHHIDHRNQIKRDNSFRNLRECTPSQNGANTGAQSNNTSGYKGIYKRVRKKGDTWVAKITAEGMVSYLGTYDTKEEAAKAYNDGAIEAFGQFACLNKI